MVERFKMFLAEYDKRAFPKHMPVPERVKSIKPKLLFNPKQHISEHGGVRKLIKKARPNPTIMESHQDYSKKLREAVANINRYIQKNTKYKGLRFDVHEEANRNFVRIRDLKTGEQTNQIQTDFILELAGRLRNASGIIKNTKA